MRAYWALWIAFFFFTKQYECTYSYHSLKWTRSSGASLQFQDVPVSLRSSKSRAASQWTSYFRFQKTSNYGFIRISKISNLDKFIIYHPLVEVDLVASNHPINLLLAFSNSKRSFKKFDAPALMLSIWFIIDWKLYKRNPCWMRVNMLDILFLVYKLQ